MPCITLRNLVIEDVATHIPPFPSSQVGYALLQRASCRSTSASETIEAGWLHYPIRPGLRPQTCVI